jgi:hypothetical protein
MGMGGPLVISENNHPLAHGAYLSVESCLMEAKIENTFLKPFLATLKPFLVTVG